MPKRNPTHVLVYTTSGEKKNRAVNLFVVPFNKNDIYKMDDIIDEFGFEMHLPLTGEYSATDLFNAISNGASDRSYWSNGSGNANYGAVFTIAQYLSGAKRRFKAEY